MNGFVPEIQGNLRKKMVRVPEVINEAPGIRIFGKLIKSLVFSTDVAIIKNCNANAVVAVYPFTPQPIISQSIIAASDVPVFCGVGGGITSGNRTVNLAVHAEYQGAIGIVVNDPTKNDVIAQLRERIDIPIMVTVVSDLTDIKARIESGASIINVSGASRTAEIVRSIREISFDVPIVATGGPNEESIIETIQAGANAITFTPPTPGEILKGIMENHRQKYVNVPSGEFEELPEKVIESIQKKI
jgi:hypothetical protein